MDETSSVENAAKAGEALKARTEWLEQRLNSDGNLPQVETVILDGKLSRCDGALPANVFDGNAGSVYINLFDHPIGDIVFGRDKAVPNKLVITDASILPQLQGRGFGRRLYLEALKALPEDYGAVSHSMLSPDAERVWQWLIENGVAKESEGIVSGQAGKFETVF